MKQRFLNYILIFLSFFYLQGAVYAQLKEKRTVHDSISEFILFKDKFIFHASTELLIPPLFITFREQGKKTHLNYKINQGINLGVGAAYKGISLNLSYMLIKNIENKEKHGKTSYLGLGMGIPIKRFYLESSFARFKGYALNKASFIIPNYVKSTLLLPNLSNLQAKIALSFFANRKFNFKAAEGREGHYTKRLASVYYKVSLDGDFIDNNKQSIVPSQLLGKLINQNRANHVGAFTFGMTPGIFYVMKLGNWQLSGIVSGGVGIQYKYYVDDDYSRGFLGITPKLDTKINMGYNPDSWFIMLKGEFEYSQIKMNTLFIPSTMFIIKLNGGYRFNIQQKTKNMTSHSI